MPKFNLLQRKITLFFAVSSTQTISFSCKLNDSKTLLINKRYNVKKNTIIVLLFNLEYIILANYLECLTKLRSLSYNDSEKLRVSYCFETS